VPVLGRRVGIRTEHAGRVAATTVVSYSYEQEINTHLVNRKKKKEINKKSETPCAIGIVNRINFFKLL